MFIKSPVWGESWVAFGNKFSEWNHLYTNWVDFIMYNNMILQHGNTVPWG